MNKPSDFDLLELATPYALHAVSESERVDTKQRVAAAPAPVAEAFRAEVRGVREAMAVVSAATQIEPPVELRERVLAAVRSSPPRQFHWRSALLAAAAVLAIVIIAVGIGLALRPPALPSTADQVFTASDRQSVSSPFDGGIATLVYSHQKDAGVLVLDDVAPPRPGTVYQLWLISDPQQPESVATLDATGVSEKTVVPELGDSTAVALTVEPGSGSEQPTSAPFAELSIT